MTDSNAEMRDKVATLIWERFAPSSDMEPEHALRGEYVIVADAILALNDTCDVVDAVYEERERVQAIINERDKWILELIQERDALIALVREGMNEAIPDALIFGMHTNAETWTRAKSDFQEWVQKAKAADEKPALFSQGYKFIATCKECGVAFDAHIKGCSNAPTARLAAKGRGA